MSLDTLISRVESADKDELIDLFAPLMRKVREYSQSHSVSMLFDTDEEGGIVDYRLVVLKDENNYVPPDVNNSYEYHVSAACDPFLSYEEIKEKFVLPRLRDARRHNE